MPPQGPSPGMFAQMAQQGSPQPPMPPMMPPQGEPQMPQGSPPPSPQGPPPAGQGGIPPQILQMLMQVLQQQKQQVPQQLAQQGRNGDSMIAHLTPGEMMVPPQVQTHKVLATLDKAFKSKHISPQQFTAGSPQSSTNPKTGVPEYNFLSAFLPAALGIAGAVVAPELLPALGATGLSAGLTSAIGSGAGTALGGIASGQSPTQAALSGLGAGAGGYALGSLGAGAAAGSAGNPIGPPAPGLSNLWGNLPAGSINPMRTLGSTLGGAIGSSIGAPPVSNAPNYPKGFNDPMPAVGSLGSAQKQLGMTNSVQPRPSFTGFDPQTNNPGAFNFYPGSQ